MLNRRKFLTIGTAGAAGFLLGIGSTNEAYATERPEKPTITKHAPNVLDIKTNGYDINLESYLKDQKLTVVELGAYWCKPCKCIISQILKEGAKYDSDFIMVDLSFPDENGGTIDSPAYRYAVKNGARSFPFFLVYDGKNLKGTIDYENCDLEDLVEKAKKLK